MLVVYYFQMGSSGIVAISELPCASVSNRVFVQPFL